MKRLTLFIANLFLITALFSHPEDTKVYTYKASSDIDKNVSITCNIEGNKCTVIVKKDGETKEFSFPLDNLDILDSLKEELSKSFSNIDILQSDSSFCKTKTAWLGVNIQPLTDQLRDFFKVRGSGGVLISEVVEDSPAEKVGFKAGDVIISVDGDKVEDGKDLVTLIRGKEVGEKVKIKIIRNGRKRTINVVLGEKELNEPHIFSFFKHKDDNDSPLSYPPGMFKFPQHKFNKELKNLKNEMKELRKELEELKEELKTLKKT